MYTWILSTGWWQSRAPVNPDAVVVVIILCACLIGGFFYLNRLILSLPLSMLSISSYIVEIACFWHVFLLSSLPCRASSSNSIKKKSYQSMLLMIFIASLYCLWCTIQIYWITPRRPAVGEEADLGVLVFLAVYFFLPYGLCIMSMYPKDLDSNQIPL
jgi:hypothetical protein